MASDDSALDKGLTSMFEHGHDLSKDELRARNVDFMLRCAEGRLGEKESMRGGRWAQNLSPEKRNELKSLIFAYDNWSPATDPTETHGNGVVIFEGNYVMWAIREFDTTPPGILMLEPQMELRLLIMHSSEI